MTTRCGHFAEFYGYFSAYVFLGAVAGLELLFWCFGASALFGKHWQNKALG